MVQEDDGHPLRVRCHEYRRPLDADGRRNVKTLEKLPEWERRLSHELAQDLAAALPRRHEREHQHGDDHRHPTAVWDLEQIGEKEREIDRQKERQKGPGFESTPTKALDR